MVISLPEEMKALSTPEPRIDNKQALSWLDEELERALDRGQEKLATLLRTVREEILFEMRLGELSLTNGSL